MYCYQLSIKIDYFLTQCIVTPRNPRLFPGQVHASAVMQKNGISCAIRLIALTMCNTSSSIALPRLLRDISSQSPFVFIPEIGNCLIIFYFLCNFQI